MQAYLFLTIYFLALQLHNSNAFHLEGVKRVAENNRTENRDSDNESVKIGTIVLFANKTLNLTETTAHSLKKLENELLPTVKSNSSNSKPSDNSDEMKMHAKHWRATKYAVPEKPFNARNIVSHPKRESVNHPTWHKNLKDSHKLSSVNGAKGNRFNGFDIVVVDIPTSYSRMRWDKPRANALTSPSYHYVPTMNPAPSIFDFFLGLNSISGNFLTDPAEMENEIYFEQSFDNPPWNRRLSSDRLMSPAAIDQKAMSGDRIAKDVNSIQNCTCPCAAARQSNP